MIDSRDSRTFVMPNLRLLFIMLAFAIAGIMASWELEIVVNMDESAKLFPSLLVSLIKFAFVFSLALVCIKHKIFTVLMVCFAACSAAILGFFSCVLVRQSLLMLLLCALPSAIYMLCEFILFSVAMKKTDVELQFHDKSDIINKEAELVKTAVKLLPLVAVDLIIEMLRCIIKV